MKLNIIQIHTLKMDGSIPYIDNDLVSMYSYASADKPKEKEKKYSTKQTKIVLFTLLIGQILSMLSVTTYHLCFDRITVSTNIPTIIYSIFYLIFGVVWMCVNKCHLSKPRNFYYIILFFDSQSIYLQCLSITHFGFNFIFIFIFFLLSMIFTFILKFIIMTKYKYIILHYVAFGITVAGTIILILGIFFDTDKELFSLLAMSNKLGFLFMIVSSILNSFSITLQEYYFKKQDIYEYFNFSGPVIAIILFIESFITDELSQISTATFSNLNNILYIIGFIFANFIFYSIKPFFIKQHTANLYSSNLICNIFYLYLVRLIFGEQSKKALFFFIGGIVVNIIGLYIFDKYKCVKVSKNELTNSGSFSIEKDLTGKGGLIPDDENEGDSIYDKRNSIYRSRAYSTKYIE